MTITVQCPTCSAPVEWKAENTYRPFCCERCKLIDLGAWAAEEHAIPVSYTHLTLPTILLV